MAASKQKRDPKGLYLEGDPSDDPAQLVAEAAIRPEIQSALTIFEYNRAPFGDVELTSLVDALSDQTKATTDGDLSRGEVMLSAQAHTLDQLFNTLARRAIQADSLAPLDTYLKLALRAQAQCRAIWEALAEIKNPPILGYVRQANIAHGPQQVNNLSAAPSEAPHARENQNLQNKLLEKTDGNRLDPRAAGSAGGVDPAMATLGALDRAKHRGR